jgi:uncharacterized protein YbjT (DUF2867 family)
MKIVVTGTTGYIGKRLLSILAAKGHELICPVRDPRRFETSEHTQSIIQPIKADLLDADSLKKLPTDIDAVYYLVHSMQSSSSSFADMEARAAQNFAAYLKTTTARQVIFLSGIANDEQLSKHLTSRKNVEHILQSSGVPLTTLRAAIIIGSGSASFEIIRDLVEKLPFMVAPRWLNTRCQPIAIRNVIDYLEGVLGKESTYNQVFDIGGPDILTYKQMLLGFAKVRGLKRLIVTVPVLSPGISSYWLYFVTSTSFTLARSLVDSMKNEVICQRKGISDIIPVKLLSYEDALKLAFQKISHNEVISSWTDTLAGSHVPQNYLDFIQLPHNGCLTDSRRIVFTRNSEQVMSNIWAIGGTRGWYYGDFLWKIRGALDKMVGGVGLRRGRRSPDSLYPGDALDFWRVLLADTVNKRLLLYAEMKLPGEAWLEFKIQEEKDHYVLVQTATFRPLGLLGRLYWYSLLPFHFFIFKKMAQNIISYQSSGNVLTPVKAE